MDVNDTAEEQLDYTLFNFIYGFIALLGICVLFSLAKAIYHYYKERAELNVPPAEDNTVIENQSMSSRSSISDREEIHDNNGTNSERLNTQLDKLRRLLNRLNAMGTFSRDTIGDLSAQSTSYANNSREASCDLSNIWSSIDFDDLEESTIIEDNFGKTLTEKSVSLSVSDISLDTSGIQYDKMRRKNVTSSNEYTSNIVSSMLSRQTNPSDAIDQILAVLDSIMAKNNRVTFPVKNNIMETKINSNESVNVEAFQPPVRSKYPIQSASSQEVSMPSSSSVSLDNQLLLTCESVNSETIKMPGFKRSNFLNAKSEPVDSALIFKSKLLDHVSKVNNSQCKTPRIQTKMSKEINVVNEFTSCDESKHVSTTTLTSSKDPEKNTASSSVSLCVDPIRILPIQLKKNSESSMKSVVSRESNLKQDGNSAKMPFETNVASRTLGTLDLGAVRRSHSLSKLLDQRVSLVPVRPHFVKSYSSEKHSEISFSKSRKVPNIVITVSENEDSQCCSPKANEVLGRESEKCENRLSLHEKGNISYVSSTQLHLPLFADTVALKSSDSESEMKQTPYLERFSPSISSGSVSFLSPVPVSDLSPVEKIDWKSPVEPASGISLLNNRTQRKQYSLSRSACMWSTPPSPPKRASSEAVLF